jgi:hypothetical protein
MSLHETPAPWRVSCASGEPSFFPLFWHSALPERSWLARHCPRHPVPTRMWLPALICTRDPAGVRPAAPQSNPCRAGHTVNPRAGHIVIAGCSPLDAVSLTAEPAAAAGSATTAGLARLPEARPDGPHHIPALGVPGTSPVRTSGRRPNGRPMDVGRAEFLRRAGLVHRGHSLAARNRCGL